MIFYFSGTGNSAWAARSLADNLNEKLVSIAEALQKNDTLYNILQEESVGFVFPTYGWDIPPIVRTFITCLSLQYQDKKGISRHKNMLDSTYIYFVTTCGDDTGKLLKRVRQAFTLRNLHIDSAWTIVMPDSYVCLPGFDVDSDKLKESKLSAAPQRLQMIATHIKRKQRGVFDVHPGHFPYTKTYILGGLFRHYLMDDKPFHTKDSCTQCGICVDVCPTKNIIIGTEGPHWQNQCTMCLACYHHCPSHAIAYGKQTKHKGQYLHPEAPRTKRA
jgi:ferredoxin